MKNYVYFIGLLFLVACNDTANEETASAAEAAGGATAVVAPTRDIASCIGTAGHCWSFPARERQTPDAAAENFASPLEDGGLGDLHRHQNDQSRVPRRIGVPRRILWAPFPLQILWEP